MIAQTDVIILSALRVGLSDIRKNQFLIDDIMCQFMSDPYLKTMYGKKQIDRFKEFLNKNIFVGMATRLPDTTKLPAIVIQIGGGNEDAQKGALGDSDVKEDVDPATLGGVFNAPQIIVQDITPDSYSKDTGELTFSQELPNDVFAGQFVYDTVNNKSYEIQFVLDAYTLVLDTDLTANFTNMQIRPIRDVVRHTKKSIWFYENYTITCVSTEPNELMYLYNLVLYILGRYKKPLIEARNFYNVTYSYGPLYDPTPGDDTNILFARDINITGRVEHQFIESTDKLLQGINTELLIALAVDAEIDAGRSLATDKTPEGVYNPQVKDQDWEMERDIEYREEGEE